jgi:hypothetical protein
LGVRETPVTAMRWLARNSVAACLMLGMVRPLRLAFLPPVGTAGGLGPTVS